MSEQANYAVRATLTIVIPDALSKFDAIQRATETLPDVWDALESVGWAVEFDAATITPVP